jgi:hypothetical protein
MTLKAKLEIMNQYLNCNNGSVNWKLRKTGNAYSSKVMRQWFVSARARNLLLSGTMYSDMQKK